MNLLWIPLNCCGLGQDGITLLRVLFETAAAVRFILQRNSRLRAGLRRDAPGGLTLAVCSPPEASGALSGYRNDLWHHRAGPEVVMAEFPVDSDLDDQIKSLYKGGPGSASPMEVHKPIWRAAELNALSSRRLTVAIEKAAKAQNRSADQMWWLTAVILFFTVVAACGTILEGGRVFAWW